MRRGTSPKCGVAANCRGPCLVLTVGGINRIQDHKVEDLSIKLQFNTYDKWTRALKYMLTNIKWLVASSVTRRD